MSTPQGSSGSRKPGTVRTTASGSQKSPGAKPSSGAKPGTRPAGRPGAGGGGNRKRPPVVVVKKQTNWAVVGIASLVGVLVLGIIGYAVYSNYNKGLGWQTKADRISGVVDYRKKNPKIITAAYRNHVYGAVKYETTPPSYGNHNPNWQRCQGDVYDAQIANENAVHALEHGAVWITYDPAKINATQVNQLASSYVNGNDFTLMSPYPGQPSPISLQAWGFQLRLSSPTDPRIKQFLTDLRQNATLEPGTPCSSGSYITATGTTPHNPTGAPAPSGAASAGSPSAATSPPAS